MASSIENITEEVEITLRTLHLEGYEEEQQHQIQTEIYEPSHFATNTNDIETSSKLHRALITYVVHAGRILFAEDSKTWHHFHYASTENAEKYVDITPEVLCFEFMKKVLPQIYKFNLTAEEKNVLGLLELHPEYKRVDDGYVRAGREQRIANNRQPKENIDFRIVTEENHNEIFTSTNTLSSEDFELASSQAQPPPSQTLLLTTNTHHEHKKYGYDFEFSKENAALISATLSNDLELSGCVLFEPAEIHRRLHFAKRNFEQRAEMPVNCIDTTQLLGKIEGLKKLRDAVTDIITKRFL